MSTVHQIHRRQQIDSALAACAEDLPFIGNDPDLWRSVAERTEAIRRQRYAAERASAAQIDAEDAQQGIAPTMLSPPRRSRRQRSREAYRAAFWIGWIGGVFTGVILTIGVGFVA